VTTNQPITFGVHTSYITRLIIAGINGSTQIERQMVLIGYIASQFYQMFG
jgi:hypothetical protein